MIKFKNVWKNYRKGRVAVENLSLEVKEGETLVLLGKSGCGKSTTLKMVNRLVDPTQGTITVAGEDVLKQDLIKMRRQIGYAVQDVGLFPHMTVAENIEVVPKLLKWSKSKIDQRVDELLLMFGMEPKDFRDCYPSRLSGGQKQRIGAARALAADPAIILMDEPFGALDPITREQIQQEFLELNNKMKKTVIFVTHDLLEAVTIGDRIALMDQGKLVQLATPREFVENPQAEFVDQFLGRNRFQLSLVTQTVTECIERCKKPSKQKPLDELPNLEKGSTLLDAIALFRETQMKTLPVFAGEDYQGELKRESLIDHVRTLLSEQ